jgi:hypothetical protein
MGMNNKSIYNIVEIYYGPVYFLIINFNNNFKIIILKKNGGEKMMYWVAIPYISSIYSIIYILVE